MLCRQWVLNSPLVTSDEGGSSGQSPSLASPSCEKRVVSASIYAKKALPIACSVKPNSSKLFLGFLVIMDLFGIRQPTSYVAERRSSLVSVFVCTP